MEQSIDEGFVNLICLCKLSLHLIDLSMPFVIHTEFLYLLNVTNLYDMFNICIFKYIHEYVVIII